MSSKKSKLAKESSVIIGSFLANGTMYSNHSGAGDIRSALIEADLVDCMVVLPLEYRKMIPEYIKDHVSLNQFVS